jgi:hypothetical protein
VHQVTARRTSGRTDDRSTGGPPWRAPTRRAFVAMISAAAAALAAPSRARLLLGPAASGDDPPRRPTKTLWIGHC